MALLQETPGTFSDMNMPGSTEPLDGAVDLGERVETGASGPITEDGAISIGGIWFTANPQDINVTIEQKVKTSYVLRQAGTRVPEKIMSTVVNVNMQIGPNDYAGLVQLVRMYRMAPFVPIVNFKINGHYSVFFVALQSINDSFKIGLYFTALSHVWGYVQVRAYQS